MKPQGGIDLCKLAVIGHPGGEVQRDCLAVNIQLTQKNGLILLVLATNAQQARAQDGDDFLSQPVQIHFPQASVLGGQCHIAAGQRITITNEVRVGAAFQNNGEAFTLSYIDHLLRNAVSFGDDALIFEPFDVNVQMCQGETIHGAGRAFKKFGYLPDESRVINTRARMQRFEDSQRLEQLRSCISQPPVLRL
jgi:hypothetical protein